VAPDRPVSGKLPEMARHAKRINRPWTMRQWRYIKAGIVICLALAAKAFLVARNVSCRRGASRKTADLKVAYAAAREEMPRSGWAWFWGSPGERRGRERRNG
jgi:hypothetical protein